MAVRLSARHAAGRCRTVVLASRISSGLLHHRTSYIDPELEARTFSTSPTPARQHLLYFGNVLGYTSAERLSKLPRAWIDAVGGSSDVDHGVTWTHASGSPSHSLLSYTLLERPLDHRAPRQDSTQLSTPSSSAAAAQESGLENQNANQHEDIVLDLSDDAHSTGRSSSSHPSKVFSIGRNTHAQLGLGFASQEATRGLVTGTLEGKGGITKVAAGNGFSLVATARSASPVQSHTSGDSLATAQEDLGSNLYGFGNDTLGQLGLSGSVTPSSQDPWDISPRNSESGEPQLLLHPLPRQISLDEHRHEASNSGPDCHSSGEASWTVKDMSCGMDHSLLLLERTLGGYTMQEVVASGLNTDGQLGLTPLHAKDEVPLQPLLTRRFEQVPLSLTPISVGHTGSETGAEKAQPSQMPFDKIVDVSAGADTSIALMQSGSLWVWGNSEYGQALCGVQDRVVAPLHIRNPLDDAYARFNLDVQRDGGAKVTKVVTGGSFTALLDSQGRAWTVGFGPLPDTVDQQKEQQKTENGKRAERWFETLQLVTDFEEAELTVVDLWCSTDYVVAATVPQNLESDLAGSTEGNEEKSGRTESQRPELWIWGIPPHTVSSLAVPAPTPIPYRIPQTPHEAWLQSNPSQRDRQNKPSKTSSEATVAQVTQARIAHMACNRDNVLVVLEDGRAPVGVWAECISPPQDKGSDLVG
ncbi:RCC1/BLIP-II [Testicularia cyperi]|uniref:RCC1/BLIP-II n=1 Tax=Testicularia cyperi TaxID=1882483 RepID=A0A317XZP1_9BASI|nr:RCC1/BLIP-II [Testicularia cyperi]